MSVSWPWWDCGIGVCDRWRLEALCKEGSSFPPSPWGKRWHLSQRAGSKRPCDCRPGAQPCMLSATFKQSVSQGSRRRCAFAVKVTFRDCGNDRVLRADNDQNHIPLLAFIRSFHSFLCLFWPHGESVKAFVTDEGLHVSLSERLLILFIKD